MNVYLSSLQFMLFGHQTLDSLFIFQVQSLLLQNQRIKIITIIVIKVERTPHNSIRTSSFGNDKVKQRNGTHLRVYIAAFYKVF